MTALYDTIHLIERLHRHFLHVVKIELDRMGLKDITNVQSLIIYNIGDEEMTVGELTARGYYLGSNVSYNVKRMVENGYLAQQRSVYDRRSTVLTLTEKGKEVNDFICNLLKKHMGQMEEMGITREKLDDVNEMMVLLQRFFNGQTDVSQLSLNANAA